MTPGRQVLRVLELFSGTGSVSIAFRRAGHEVISLDISPRYAPSICANILDWQYKNLPRGHFDVVWASCPCEHYSIARSNASTPRDLLMADTLVLRTQEIIEWFGPRHYFVENPSGSQLWLRFKWPRLVKTSYCAYGFPYRKNTTIATNCVDFSLKDPCGGAGVCESMVGNIHMEHAQKGGGGASNVYHTRDELHRIPQGLCMDVVMFCELGQGGAEESG
jgi:SAM-dependent methyltransferase